MRKTVISLCMLFVAMAVSAIPAKRGLFKNITLADGTELRAELRGDEYMHYYQAEDGRCFVEGADGVFVPMNMEEARKNASKLRSLMNASQKTMLKAPVLKSAVSDFEGVSETGFFGQKKGLILLVEFSDLKFQSNHGLEFYKKIANQPNLNETTEDGTFRGSVRDYFYDQSNGQFELDFDVYGPLTAPKNFAYYGQDNSYGSDAHIGELVAWALTQVKKDVDFTQYDWDDDGYVDQVFVVYAGMGANYGYNSNAIWPHKWELRYNDYGKVWNTGQGVFVNSYACSCELNAYSLADGIGTICHEFSHCLGYADLYDTTGGGGYGMDAWDIMCMGSYNDDSFCPAGYSGFEKWVAGWIKPIELTRDTVVTDMKPMSEGGDCYIIFNEGNRNEFYFLDNRQNSNWDDEIPGRGLLITHVDYDPEIWMNNQVNDVADHQRMEPIHADNMSSYYRYASNDTYPYSSYSKKNNTLSNTSSPAAHLYNENVDGTLLMGKSLLDITQNADGTISFSFKSMEGSNYDAQVGDVLFEETFDNCEGKGGNDGVWNEASDTELSENVEKWRYNYAYAGDGCALFGSSSKYGDAYTPPVHLTGAARLTFKAAPWAGDSRDLDVYMGSELLEFATMKDGEWTEYSYDVTGEGFYTFRFVGGKRFFLDDVKVVKTDAASGVESIAVERNTNDGRIFTIGGVYVGKDLNSLGKGIYIVNGKKIVK